MESHLGILRTLGLMKRQFFARVARFIFQRAGKSRQYTTIATHRRDRDPLVCAYVWVCYPLVRSASKPEALQRVSKRILICIANACPRFLPDCIPPLFFAGTSVSLSSKSPNKAQDVVATYSPSNVRTIGMWQTEHRLQPGCGGFTAPVSQPRILWPIRSRFFLRSNVSSLVNLSTPYIHVYV